MSPEQFRCEVADSRSDQFSFCVALYEALYQQRPFGGESIAEVAAEVLAGRRRKSPERTAVPIEIERALARGLAVDPAARFPTMAELLSALEVDRERDPAGAAAARRRMSMILGISSLALSMTPIVRGQAVVFTPRILTALMAFVIAMFLGGIIAFHKTLFKNTFHRGLTLLTLSGVVTIFCCRAMMWHLGIPIVKYYPFDLLFFAGHCAAISLQYLPQLWMISPLLLGGALACAHWPQHGHTIANIGYTLLPLGFIYGWYLTGTRAPALVPGTQSDERPSARLRRLAMRMSGRRSGKS